MSRMIQPLLVFISLFIALVVMPASVLAAHPAAGGAPEDISGWYTSCTGPDENYGEITFVAGQDKPALDSLTDMERYLVGGIHRSRKGGSMLPWYQHVYFAACAYYKLTGQWPRVLSIDELKQLPELKRRPAAELEIYRNPLTGNWPRLDAKELSPGDMYLKPLTPEEMRHFADENAGFQRVWFDGVGTDWDAMQRGESFAQSQTKRVTLMGPVCYVRVYGLNGVLMTDFVYATE